MLDSIQNSSSMMLNSLQMGSMRPPKFHPLTDEQKSQLSEILSQYDPQNITKEDAQAMFKAFRESGIGGPELKKAMEEAGFDADKVWELAHGDKPPRPPEGQESTGGREFGSINTSALETLQSILSQFNLSDMSEENQTSLIQKLKESGLLLQGGVIDIRA